MKKLLKSISPRGLWDLIIVGAILYSMFFLSSKINAVDESIKAFDYAKLEITDMHQLTTIANHLSKKEWGANGYAVYVLQPKDYKKTYKELVDSSGNHLLPNRVDLASEIDLELLLYEQQYYQLDHTNVLDTSYELRTNEVCIILPIYYKKAVIAEIYTFFNNTNDAKEFLASIENHVAEAQVISKLIN